MTVRARVGGWGSYKGHSGWNLWGKLSFKGRTGTTAESGVREGYLVTKPSLLTGTDVDIRFGGARGGPGINNNNNNNQYGQRQRGGRVGGARGGPGNKTNPPLPSQHQYGQIQWGGGQRSWSCARETEKLGRTHRDITMGAAQDVVAEEVVLLVVDRTGQTAEAEV